jgi:hypothetical protein
MERGLYVYLTITYITTVSLMALYAIYVFLVGPTLIIVLHASLTVLLRRLSDKRLNDSLIIALERLEKTLDTRGDTSDFATKFRRLAPIVKDTI